MIIEKVIERLVFIRNYKPECAGCDVVFRASDKMPRRELCDGGTIYGIYHRPELDVIELVVGPYPPSGQSTREILKANNELFLIARRYCKENVRLKRALKTYGAIFDSELPDIRAGQPLIEYPK